MPKQPPVNESGADGVWQVVTAETPLGPIRGVVSGGRLGYSSMKADGLDDFLANVRRRLGAGVTFAPAAADSPVAQQFEDDVQRLLHGQAATLTPDLSVNTAFQKEVAAVVHQIPFGRSASYGDLAAMLGKPGGAQAVGQALPRLPFALFVPTHRVVRATSEPIGCVLLTFDQKGSLLRWEREQAGR